MIDNPDKIFPPARPPEPPPHSDSPPSPDLPPLVPVRPARRASRLAIVIIIAISAALCLCGALVAGFFAIFSTDTSTFETAIDKYMSAMARQDTQAAYDLLSRRAHQDITLDDLQRELLSSRYITYHGYQSTSIQSTSIATHSSIDSSTSQTRADVEGVITYAGGGTVSFKASLDQEDGAWKLYIIEAVRAPGVSG